MIAMFKQIIKLKDFEDYNVFKVFWVHYPSLNCSKMLFGCEYFALLSFYY